MNYNLLLDLFEENPMIAAVKGPEGLESCLESDSKIVFVLYGDILSIGGIVDRIKDAGKLAMVHIDLIDGFAARDVVVDFLRQNTRADGIISTKPALVRRAKACGMLTVQRFFVLDSIALVNIQKQLPLDAADMIEILPGVMPKIIRKLTAITKKPIIAGGLISDKEDILSALGAGAIAISSTNPNVWFM